MYTNKAVRLIALGACLLGLSAVATVKNPVARPFKGYGHATGVFTLDANGVPVSYEAFGEGNFTHLGRSTLHTEAYIDELGQLEGGVTITAANGDQLFYIQPDLVTVVFTGGTGRFTGASGNAIADFEIVYRPDPPPGTMVVDIAGYFEGTLIY